jgi:4'-phosphopantetheinyl transferase
MYLLPSTYATLLPLKRENTTYQLAFALVSASLEKLCQEATSFLHPKEQIFFQTLSFKRRQQSYLLGRYSSKIAATLYYKTSLLTDFWLESGIFGQPLLYSSLDLGNEKIQISLSHSENRAVAVVFPEAHPLSIDIEKIEKERSFALQSSFSLEEQEKFQSLSCPLEKSFTLFWTAKEALSKVLKCGLMCALPILEIETLTPHSSFFQSTFKNFKQYQAFSFLFSSFACSLLLPRRTSLELLPLISALEEFSGFVEKGV